jgi:hypothetical protein
MSAAGSVGHKGQAGHAGHAGSVHSGGGHQKAHGGGSAKGLAAKAFG